MNCQESKSYITAYIDEQLEAPQQADLEKHITECTECQSLMHAEGRFRDFVRDVYQAEKAPVRLRAKIRKKLKVGENRFGFLAGYFSRPRAIAGTAFAVLLFAFLGIQISKMGRQVEGSNLSRVQDLYGTVECIGCYYAELADVQNFCADFGHTLALLTETRDFYSFIPNERSTEIQTEIMHAEVKIAGWVFYQANYIEVEEFEVIDSSVAYLDLARNSSHPESL